MYNPILMALITCHLLSSAPIITGNDICPFKDTVNLTDVPLLANGTYLYYDILIPPEKQHTYNYDIKFNGHVYRVDEHLRGCACDVKPCIKLCCRHYEYFSVSENESISSSCEEISPEMQVSWDLDVKLKNNSEMINLNMFQFFTAQVGLPCPEPESLDEELGDEWILNEDGTILFPPNDLADTLNYCYSLVENNENIYKLKPYICALENVVSWKELLKAYAMTISVIFLIPTIVVYLVLKELRGNLRGKLLICYLSSLTIGYIIISVINASGIIFKYTTCVLMGFTGYYFSMAAFLWLSVLCYDIWKNFRDTNKVLNPTKTQKDFLRYSLYTWISAGLATGFLMFMQFSTSVARKYKPGIGDDRCWIDVNRWSAALYFYGPNLIILIFNVLTFIHLTRKIYKVRTDLAKMTQKDKFFKENAIVILRLFLVMGISWIFDILSYCLKFYKQLDILFVLTDVMNAVQGLLIFILFVLKPKILSRLLRLFKKDKFAESRKSTSTSSTRFSKLQTGSSAPVTNTP